MAIVSVNKRQKVDGAEQDLESKSYFEEYLVQVDDVNESPDDIRNATGVPAILDPFADDPTAFARNKRIRKTQTRLLFVVVVEFSTSTDTTQQAGGSNPLDDPPQIRWDNEDVEKIVTEDIDDKPIENSAEDPFDPPITEIDSILVCTISRNEESYDPQQAAFFKNRVNLTPITIAGFAAVIGQAKIAKFGSSTELQNGLQFFRVTYRIEVADDEPLADDGNPLFWRRDILDVGLNEIISGEKRGIVDDAGKQIDQPVKLAGAGLKLPIGEDPVYLNFTTLRSAEFAILDLPTEGLP